MAANRKTGVPPVLADGHLACQKKSQQAGSLFSVTAETAVFRDCGENS
jgi:hypothetical protein